MNVRRFCGFAPMAAYLGFEGWCLRVELRPGSRHGQKGFVDFLGESLRRARSLTDELLLVRLDGRAMRPRRFARCGPRRARIL